MDNWPVATTKGKCEKPVAELDHIFARPLNSALRASLRCLTFSLPPSLNQLHSLPTWLPAWLPVCLPACLPASLPASAAVAALSIALASHLFNELNPLGLVANN